MRNSNFLTKFFTIAATTSCLAFPTTNANAVDTITEAFKQGKPSLEMRYRFGYVNDKGFSEIGYPSTLRTALGFETAPYKGVTAKIVMNNVSGVGGLRYNDQVRQRNLNKPTEPDVTFTDVEQVYIKHSVLSFTDIYLGRKEVLHGDERFVSNTPWAQHHTTLDGVFLETSVLADTEIKMAYARNINTPLTELSWGGNMNGSFVLSYMKNKSMDALNIEFFSYLLKFRDTGDVENSTKTFGGALSGKTTIFDDIDLNYLAQYAYQNDFKNNPNTFSNSYYRFEPGFGYHWLEGSLGYELSESDGTTPFNFVLSDTHKYNGWSDRFTTMPTNGLVDYYGKVGIKLSNERIPEIVNNTKFMFEYHLFKAAKGSQGYGREYDFGIVKPINDNVKLVTIYSHFDPKTLASATKTDKVYVMFNAKF